MLHDDHQPFGTRRYDICAAAAREAFLRIMIVTHDSCVQIAKPVDLCAAQKTYVCQAFVNQEA